MVGDLVVWSNWRRPLPGDGRRQTGVSRFLYVEGWLEGTVAARLSGGIYLLEGTDGSPSAADNYGRTDGQREGAS
jgi:hypothetical protein